LRNMRRPALMRELRSHRIAYTATRDALEYRLSGVEVHVATRMETLASFIEKRIAAFAPDVALVSLEDPSLQTLDIANEVCPRRTIALAQTTYSLPFGPDNSFPKLKTPIEPLLQAASVVTCSKFVAKYIERYSELRPTPMYMPVYGRGPWPKVDSWNQPFITMINPGPQKGIDVFLALADHFTHLQFAAVPSWSTGAKDLRALEKRPNIEVFKPQTDIDQIYRRTRVLLVPSLYFEAFGLVTVEAMLRGIPVIASNVGGLPEAKLGTANLIKVRPITHNTGRLNEKGAPVPRVPRQNLRPWVASLKRLTEDRTYRLEASAQALRASHRFVRSLELNKLIATIERLGKRQR
jgi:hypothetical protein